MWIWITLALMLATPAAAQPPTCVTVCEAKADACAEQCSEVSGEDPADCQLVCAKALFQRCVASCQQTNEVVWDDYRVTDPGQR
jgi:hypothetical protein